MIVSMRQLTAAALVFFAARTVCAQKWTTLPEPGEMPSPTKSGFVSAGQARLFYETFGQGLPILLIHNGLGDADDWAPIIPLLRSRFEVVVADTRGFGRSTRDTIAYSYDLLATDYFQILDALGIRRAIVVGTSDGAEIGIEMAIKQPDRIVGLFAHGANATRDGEQDPTELSAIKLAVERSSREYRRLSATPDEYAAFRAALNKMWSNEPNISTSQLSSIRVPTAIVVSDHEESITPAHSEYLAATIPGAQLVMLHDVSHFAPLQDPEQFASAVLRFADKLPAPR